MKYKVKIRDDRDGRVVYRDEEMESDATALELMQHAHIMSAVPLEAPVEEAPEEPKEVPAPIKKKK